MNIDYGDTVIKTLITAGVFKFLRTYLETAQRLPQWERMLKYAWIIPIPLIALSNLLSLKFISDQYYYLLLLAAIFIIYQTRNFRSARLLLIAAVPFLVFGVLNDFLQYFTPNFYKSYGAMFGAPKGFAVFWMIGFGVYAHKQDKREKQQKQKDEAERKTLEAQKQALEYLVAERTVELTNQKEELENTLEKLKATQDQLIQSEKLASLGELTAGIAHEIQNPLNFVNNFAELSVELVQELNDELDKDTLDKEFIKELMHDLTQNQEKINHHGKRASSIVKGMLEHSRKSSGVKMPTDINALADEYLRLSYHGLRAKDKEFNALMETHFETPLSKIDVIPQDIGRVLLNLFNNAFYAGLQKAKLAINGYEPKVTVSTCFIAPPFHKGIPSEGGQGVAITEGDGSIEIRVKDNGTGMPDSVKAKVFQPFFTTKPTGQGTGLGLSISYDIITKGHGGTIEIETKEGEYTEFIIKLPYL